MARVPPKACLAALMAGVLACCAACGGFSVPTQGDAGSGPVSGPVRIDRSTVEGASHGGRLQVTLLSYDPRVHESSGLALVPLVAGLTLRIRNVGTSAVAIGPPAGYATLALLGKLGASPIHPRQGPCAGTFSTTPIRLARGQATHGCLAYAYTSDDPPFEFLFGVAKGASYGWYLPS
jgi:hypothetical protein